MESAFSFAPLRPAGFVNFTGRGGVRPAFCGAGRGSLFFRGAGRASLEHTPGKPRKPSGIPLTLSINTNIELTYVCDINVC